MKVAQNQMTLGELVAALEECAADRSVHFDFCNFTVAGVNSYRGYYEDLALAYKPGGYTGIPVSKLLEPLRDAIGTKFEGYKGGTYVMHKATPLWVSNYSECSDTIVTGVKKTEFGDVILLTTHAE